MLSEVVQIRWEVYKQVIEYTKENSNFQEILAIWAQVKTVAIDREKELKKRCDQFHELNMTAAQAGLPEEDKVKNDEKIQKHMHDLIVDLGLLA